MLSTPPFWGKKQDVAASASGKIRHMSGLRGSAQAFYLADYARNSAKPLCVLVPRMLDAVQLHQELLALLPEQEGVPVYCFPDWETLPYDRFFPHQDIVSERLRILSQLPALKTGIVVVAAHTSLQRLCPPVFLTASLMDWSVGQDFDSQAFVTSLQQAGYNPVTQVTQHGEFALRGGILDVFPMGFSEAIRVEMWDDSIDSLRFFDPETQRTREKVAQVQVLPAKEFPCDPVAIQRFLAAWSRTFSDNKPEKSRICQAVSSQHWAGELAYYTPFFHEKMVSWFDYLPPEAELVHTQALESALQAFHGECQERYRACSVSEEPVLPPPLLWCAVDEWYGLQRRFPVIRWTEEKRAESDWGTVAPPSVVIEKQDKSDPAAQLRVFLAQTPYVRLAVHSMGRAESLQSLLARYSINVPVLSDDQSVWDETVPVAIAVAPLGRGFLHTDSGWAWLGEDDLWGAHTTTQWQQPAGVRKRFNRGEDIRDALELSVGDFVVHSDHGIGRYQGLVILETEGYQSEFLHLVYADGDTLYVPIHALHLISRYVGIAQVVCHKLGSSAWKKNRKKSLEKIQDVAAELLAIQAQRSIKPGIAFDQHDAAYQEFCADFPFEETPDQATAIAAVIADMRSPVHMDRLICGDVGFGKTEVALRAAFLAAHHQKQVAVLVPTTLLAEQHAQTFADRFARWPIRVATLSRFNRPSEDKAILADLASGKIDIVIGTHKLLQPKVRFFDLGLLIIDEEHRFGVSHKEKFKSLRASVDILTLTATPIPRTLNMTLSQVRDLSIIASPPKRRLSVRTFVRERNPALIREAILRELLRGGQVYYVYNHVDRMHEMLAELTRYVPEARIRFAHGQMRETELERIMADFYQQRFNVLLCTTIIETGIDVPTANTMIIERADQLGLAQLHQLRGRVGRSHHQAYAYLFTPPAHAISVDASKRLTAIEGSGDLGAGFALAMHDLEIRGAGEFLGNAQSGHAQTIGFSLYMEYLQEAIHTLKAGKVWDIDKPRPLEPEIQLHIPARIPDDYLPDVHARLVFYQRLNKARDDAELDDIRSEIRDRFGKLPEPALYLFQLMGLKIRARRLHVVQADIHAKGGLIVFAPDPPIHAHRLIQWVQNDSKRYRFSGPHHIKLVQGYAQPEERLAVLRQFLEHIAP